MLDRISKAFIIFEKGQRIVTIIEVTSTGEVRHIYELRTIEQEEAYYTRREDYRQIIKMIDARIYRKTNYRI